MLVATLRDAGRLTEALEAAALALKAVHPMDGRLSFQHERIDLLNRLGRQREAMNAAAEVVGQRPRDWVAHFHMGNILDDLGDLWAARNHLGLAGQDPGASPLVFNSLGVVYMGLGLLDRAQEVLERALQLDPNLAMAARNLERIRTAPDPQGIRGIKEIAGPLPGCSECESIFFISKQKPTLCAACAAHRPAESQACPHCGHDGVALVIPQGDGFLPCLCPVCRSGSIVKKDKAKV